MATDAGAAFINQIRTIDSTLSRLNPQIASLRKKKREAQERLYKWMAARQLEEYEGVKIKKITPKPKAVRKKKDEKKRDAIALFQTIGVNDPEGLYESFQRTQSQRIG